VIHQSASCENEQCGLWLLESLFRSPILLIESTDGAGCTPLACAIENRNSEICKLLISKCDVNRLVGNNSINESYLHLAVKQIGRQDVGSDQLLNVINSLLAHGAHAGYWDVDGNTPLHIIAGDKVFLATLKIFLRHREVIDYRLNDRTEVTGLTPLMIAVRVSKSPEIVELLIESGADIRAVEPRTRIGLFQSCLEPNFDAISENVTVCVRLLQLIPESKLSSGSEEWKARQILSNKHSSLVVIADEIENQHSNQNSEGLLLMTENCMKLSNKGSSSLLMKGSSNVSNSSSNVKRRLNEVLEEEVEEVPSKSVNEEVPPPKSDQDNDVDDDAESLASGSDQFDQLQRYQQDVLETVKIWLDSENGQEMIAQAANAIVKGSEEAMTFEAALELAKRNYIEEQVKEGMSMYQQQTKILSSSYVAAVVSNDRNIVVDEKEELD